MILVDTSIWIDHFRRGRPDLEALVLADAVLCHPFVVGELACGNIRHRAEVLMRLLRLPQAPLAAHGEVLQLVERRRLMGKGLGWTDVHLLASALLARAELWTMDDGLAGAAASLGVNRTPSD